jgi:hypothetical protein
LLSGLFLTNFLTIKDARAMLKCFELFSAMESISVLAFGPGFPITRAMTLFCTRTGHVSPGQSSRLVCTMISFIVVLFLCVQSAPHSILAASNFTSFSTESKFLHALSGYGLQPARFHFPAPSVYAVKDFFFARFCFQS